MCVCVCVCVYIENYYKYLDRLFSFTLMGKYLKGIVEIFKLTVKVKLVCNVFNTYDLYEK